MPCDHPDCKKLLLALSSYLDGELDNPEQFAILKKHLDSCPDCKTVEDQMRYLLKICRSACTEKAPDKVLQLLKAKIRSKKFSRTVKI